MFTKKDRGYNGNQLVKSAGIKVDYTLDEIKEWKRCRDDVIYFIEKYIKIVTVDFGLQPMKLYEFQKEIILTITDTNRVIANCSRQLGKCHQKDVKYTVRNKKTGQILSLTAQEFHDLNGPKQE
jgi:hypothetical protein